jgi:2'-5' RNA ligase
MPAGRHDAMHGVVSLLDESHTRIISDMWRELEKDFGVRQLAHLVPFPHFSYQIARHYEEKLLVTRLEYLAGQIPSFSITAGGIGLFTGLHTVLYIPLVRTLELSQVHQQIWQAITSTGTDISAYYRQEEWVPHITLAEHDITSETLAGIISRFSTRTMSWIIPINNIAVIWDTGTQQEVRYRFELRSP